MRVKWYGTASVLLEQDGVCLLFDPFIPLNGKCFAPPIDELAAVSGILVTHGHLDHIIHIPDILKRIDGKTTRKFRCAEMAQESALKALAYSKTYRPDSSGSIVYCTAAPRNTLIGKGVAEERIRMVTPGDVLTFGPFDVRVLKGKHIAADKCLIIKTLINPRLLFNLQSAVYLAKENAKCSEAGETVVYDINVYGKRIFMMGSLNLDENTEYPRGADLLILPFQGRSDMSGYALTFIGRLLPKMVMLIHFDDTFPPISRTVKTEAFVSQMRLKYPGIQVICPMAGAEWMETVPVKNA
jgi:L-ascorbate metabolism protein UlaG (beta-lactamase superfamily)